MRGPQVAAKKAAPDRDNHVMLEEYAFLRSQGIQNSQMHLRLRMTRTAFHKAMAVAKNEGDARAAGFDYT